MINMLISYHYMSDTFLEVIRATQGHIRWLLDSGAFTAHTLNRPIKVEEYIEWLHENQNLFWQYIALDAPGDVEQTKKNLKAMTDAGLKPMPVLVMNEHTDKAKELSKISGHLCMAGGVSDSIEHYAPRMAELRRVVGKDVWIHGLGFGRGLKVCNTQVDSVDVSSWTCGKRFGHFSWFESSRGVRNFHWQKALETPFAKLPAGMRANMMQLGLTKTDIMNRDAMSKGGLSMLAMQATHAYLQFAGALEQKNVRFIFAVSGAGDFYQLLVAAQHSTNHGIKWRKCQTDWSGYKEIMGDMSKLTEVTRLASENVTKQWEIQ